MPEQNPALDPNRTALLVMDYQEGIVAQLPDAGALLDRVTAVVDDVRGRGAHVGWVRVGFDDAEFDAIPETSMFAPYAAAPEHRAVMRADGPATRIHAAFAPRPEDVRVRKIRVGAFSTTDLEQQLEKRGITTLVLAGISTSGVVLSTVREAMDRDYRIAVLRDGCADRERETHDFLTGTLFPRTATVVDVAELGGLWDVQ
ncbi:Isochorismatase (EC [Amycolatopsis camponoti]|uniref:Isochorismatase (EC) n=1 Tax=Amycolatopsis camponoti TaxID=2606593 RepID=A0A6I8LNC9_9PSEU|nr:cysteine hydrolase [Amycolatopsis camponoti]VVJ18551.1 Isochorismatase (EC [Amycolatopsis camponoti]